MYYATEELSMRTPFVLLYGDGCPSIDFHALDICREIMMMMMMMVVVVVVMVMMGVMMMIMMTMTTIW